MALFRKKGDQNGKGDGDGNGSGPPAGDGQQRQYHPGKAQAFFERAKTVHDTTNYEFAVLLWLNGLRQDPTNMRALEAFFTSASAFAGQGQKPSKETLSAFGGRDDLEKYLAALLHAGIKPLDALLAVRAAQAAARLNLPEPTHLLGERALMVVANEKKPRKDLFLKLVEAFSKVGAYDRAVLAGEQAVKLDPSDGKLAAEVRNLAAQATMSKGGYEQSGQAGGFRANIKDLEGQRRLEEGERISRTEDVLDRVIKAAEDDYRSRPDDPHVVMKYARELRARGRPEDLNQARSILRKAYAATRQFRFREMDGDIKLIQAARKLAEYRQAAEDNPASDIAQKRYKAAQQEFLRLEIEEFKLRVENYPTDLGWKFELGKRYFELGDLNAAIPLFQESQQDAKRRVESQHSLAQAFQQIDYIDEAISTYRHAMDAHKVPTDELGLSLRYGLMTALQAKAEKERDLPSAEEADKLASAIAIQQFNFRDIRARRDILKKLIGDLKRGDAA